MAPGPLARVLQYLLWRLTKHDCIPLNPSWQVLHKNREYSVYGDAKTWNSRLLPLKYTMIVESQWSIEYAFRGPRSGTCSFSLAAHDDEPFCHVQRRVSLPYTLTVARNGDTIYIDGEATEFTPPKPGVRWLTGDFRFVEDSGGVFTRRTSHRIRQDRGQDDGYFVGGAYQEYDADPGIHPDGVLDRISEHRPLTGTFLDAGCATGLLVEAAMRRGLTAHGIDHSQWAINRANERTGGKCRQLDLATATKADFEHSYDIITMHSVLEHLGDPQRALELLYELTNPGGIVVIQTLNADSLMHRILGRDWGGYEDYTHKSPWLTARWLEDASRKTGFRVLALNRSGVWNSHTKDGAWCTFADLLQAGPASTLLSEELGDFVEVTLQRNAVPCEP